MSHPLVDDLLEQAEHLTLRDETGRPRQVNLRRAVSCAYYALFHEIVDAGVSAVLSAQDARGPIGARLRRTVRHASLKTAAGWFERRLPEALEEVFPDGPHPGGDLRWICIRLVELQNQRHRADYDLVDPFSRGDVRRLVKDARRAIELFRALQSSRERTVFLLGCLFGEQLLKNRTP